MAITEYVELFDHAGHKIEAAVYAQGTPQENHAVECLTCGIVLSDDTSHTPEQVELLRRFCLEDSSTDLLEKIKTAFPRL